MKHQKLVLEALRLAVEKMKQECEAGGDTRKFREAIEKGVNALSLFDSEASIRKARRVLARGNL